MNQGIYQLAANMVNQLNSVDILSNNLANATTTGFKEDNIAEGSFNYYLKKAQSLEQNISKMNVITNTIPKIDQHYYTKTVGSIEPTNNKLDFAIKDPNLFFKVQNPKNNELLLTRDGSFNILDGKLVTKNGYFVLNNDNLPIVVIDNFATQISVVKTQYKNLTKQGNNNYQIKSTKSLEKLIGNKEYILQGALEKSNVNTVLTMVNLIEKHRMFEQDQKAINGIDDINQKVIDKIENR
jgi:flagellar basal-body rod protein FlgG